MQNAFCHAAQWSWSVIHEIIFINPAFCSEKKPKKTPTQQVFLRISSAAGSSTRIIRVVLWTWWYQPSSWYGVWEQDSVPSLTRKGYKIFWSQTTIIIQTQNGKNISQFKLHTDRRQDEAMLEELLDSTNFYYLFKTIYAALDLLETVLTALFGYNDSGSTF